MHDMETHSFAGFGKHIVVGSGEMYILQKHQISVHTLLCLWLWFGIESKWYNMVSSEKGNV